MAGCTSAVNAGRGRAADGETTVGDKPQSSGHGRSGRVRHTCSASVFGAQTKLIVLHEEEAVAARAMGLAMAELRQVEQVLSLYRLDSAVCQLNRQGVLARPHSFLVEVMRKAQRLSELSGGAFDIKVQPLWELYATAKRAGRVPEPTEIESARSKVDWRKVAIARHRIRLGEPGMAVGQARWSSLKAARYSSMVSDRIQAQSSPPARFCRRENERKLLYLPPVGGAPARSWMTISNFGNISNSFLPAKTTGRRTRLMVPWFCFRCPGTCG